ncbi:MAG: ABC transporter permease, partial [Sedimenticola sp.]
MELIHLSPFDLSIAALLVVGLAIISWRLQLGVEKKLLWASLRTVLQLTLLGLVLKTLFAQVNPYLIGLLALFMLTVAGYEVMARQQKRFSGIWGMGIGTLSMFISSFSITLLALHLVVRVDPWYTPQYLIPLLGMMLGNTMSGMAIALDNLTHNAS